MAGDAHGVANAAGADGIGERIRRFRTDKGISLSQLAERSGMSKGYLSALENSDRSGQPTRRPSAKTLYAIAQELGVTMSDLLGRRLLIETPDRPTPESLQEFADRRGLPAADLEMLKAIRFRGEPPRTAARWEYIYNAISTSEAIDNAGE